MKRILAGIALMISFSLNAQKTVVQLYKGAAPGSEGWKQKEVEYINPVTKGIMLRNVVNPTLTIYLPESSKTTGTAVIVAPGGGFHWLSWEDEGTKVAEWLQARGIAAFVLKYRLADMGQTDEEFQKKSNEFMQQLMGALSKNKSGTLVMDSVMGPIRLLAEEDGRTAMKYVRKHAAEFHLNPDHIGMIGFSAGGMVTMGVAINHDMESKPDFIAPIYGAPLTDIKVPDDAAPLFFVCAADDPLSSSRAMPLYTAWIAAGKSAEIHIYSKGGHGFGMQKHGLPVDTWIDRFGDWLSAQGLMKR